MNDVLKGVTRRDASDQLVVPGKKELRLRFVE